MDVALERAIERMAGIAFLAVGLSHLLRPREWVGFFTILRSLGLPGGFVNGMMSLSFGALIVAFHGGQWDGPGAVVTVVGWAQVAKGTLHLCFPAFSLRSMALVAPEQFRRFSAVGMLMIPLAGTMLYASFR